MKNSNNMDATKFAWVYLVEHGFGGVQPSYYGCWKFVDPAMNESRVSIDTARDTYLKQIHDTGVNWKKTCAPISDSVSRFQGTFCDSSTEEFIRGNLVLNDGTVQVWCAAAISVSNVFDMMARAELATEKFHRFFNE